jgi:tetratricopeptide (TPR) repeat protein
MEQIEDEVKSARRQAQLTPVGHPDRVTRLHDLGNKLERLYDYTKNIEHLDEAISVSRQVTQIPPIDQPKQVWKFNNLASKICLRYLCTKEMDDLDECIKVSRQAVQLTPFSDHFLGTNMYNLGFRLRLRYKHTGETEHLREAFSVCGQGLQHEPPDRRIISTGLKQLGEVAEILYQRTGKIEDLEEAIAVTTQVVQLMPEHEWAYTEWLDKLGDLVEEHYKFTENMEDLDEAIRISRHVVQRTYPDHPNFDKRRDNLDRKIQLQSQSTRGSTVENLAQQLESLQMGSVDSLPQIGSGSNIPTSNQLCRLCQTVFERDDYFDTEASPNPTPKSWILHHHENDLEDSASAGCHLCSLILCALQKKRTNPSQEGLARMAANADFGRQIGLGLMSSLGQGGMAIIAPKSESSPFQTFATSLSFTHDLGKASKLVHSQIHISR